MRDQRQHQRFPFILRVDYQDKSECVDATENLSRGGLFIQTDRKFEIDQIVPLSLSFPGLMNPLEIIGRVAWLRPKRGDITGGVGVCVDRDVDKKRLEALVSTVQSEAELRPRPPVQNLPPEGFKILIVEDNPHIVEMYSYVLKKLAVGDLKGQVPIQVSFAPEGHQALQQLAEIPFNLVLTDLYMPVMDGFQLVERIRVDERLKNIPIICISAGGKDAQERALTVGVDIYLKKPVKFAEVLETVKQLLHIH
jgi:uncharacterized protein (TIGR02266 family)